MTTFRRCVISVCGVAPGIDVAADRRDEFTALATHGGRCCHGRKTLGCALARRLRCWPLLASGGSVTIRLSVARSRGGFGVLVAQEHE